MSTNDTTTHDEGQAPELVEAPAEPKAKRPARPRAPKSEPAVCSHVDATKVAESARTVIARTTKALDDLGDKVRQNVARRDSADLLAAVEVHGATIARREAEIARHTEAMARIAESTADALTLVKAFERRLDVLVPTVRGQ